ncbi:MAG: aldo/keto reductase [Ruminococcus sp.]|nr:aldo/keto reductase [Ruminococcus sp.]
MSDSTINENIKKLGFGLMRLPRNGEEIDIEQVKQMVDKFMSEGFTYFDTARVYQGSEEAARQALVDRYPRESFQLATKNAAWANCKTREEAIGQFETSLEKTNAGYFDFYLLHNLGNDRTKKFEDFDMWSFVKEKKEEGKIRHIGFSFHSTADELEEILKAHPEVEFVQLQINYADWEDKSVQSRANYEMARRYGKKIVIMEPVKGGMLANPPEPVKEVFRESDKNASFASWAIRFAASLDGVITVLSGMSNMEQLEDNISYMKDFTSITDEERKTLDKARKTLAEIPLIPCTGCNYCAKVCPKNIGVSASFSFMNTYKLYGDKQWLKNQLDWNVKGPGKGLPSDCIRCGRCEEVCPQHIEIRKELEAVAKAAE